MARICILFLFLFGFHCCMKSLDFSKPVTFSILGGILERQAFTQLSLSREKNVSLGQVNKVAKYLLERNLISKERGSYSLNSPRGIIDCIASSREMRDSLIGRFPVFLPKDEALAFLGEKGVLCLDSALEQFHPHVTSGRVCAYAPKAAKREIVQRLSDSNGNNLEVWLFSEDLPVEAARANGKNVTSKKRTAIDLACDNACFAANDLFREIWGRGVL